jgi:hypothetical protein
MAEPEPDWWAGVPRRRLWIRLPQGRSLGVELPERDDASEAAEALLRTVLWIRAHVAAGVSFEGAVRAAGLAVDG